MATLLLYDLPYKLLFICLPRTGTYLTSGFMQ